VDYSIINKLIDIQLYFKSIKWVELHPNIIKLFVNIGYRMSTIITPTNKKFAVLIGINYVGTDNELNGCINDANHLKTFLIEKCNYLPQNILMLADDGVNTKPTKQNIINTFNTLINKAVNEQFTELWFSYSGHGSYLTDTNGDENDGKDEVLCPVDFDTSGMIVDDFIYANLVCKLPKTVTLFALMDCCHSGTVFDLPLLYVKSLTTNNTNNKHIASVVSISGCRDDQTSADAYINSNYEGAMTWSFLNALANAKYNIKLVDLVNNMRVLLSGKYTQVPQLAISSNAEFDRMLIGGSTTPANTPTPVAPTSTKAITFTIKVDYWFKESSWNVWSMVENKYIFPIDNKFTYKYESQTITKDLVTGNYKLVVRDTYGDGGVTSMVKNGLVTLVSAKMLSGSLAEYSFII